MRNSVTVTRSTDLALITDPVSSAENGYRSRTSLCSGPISIFYAGKLLIRKYGLSLLGLVLDGRQETS